MFSRVYVLGWVGLGVYCAREGRGCQRRASLAIALARALRARGFASRYLYHLACSCLNPRPSRRSALFSSLFSHLRIILMVLRYEDHGE